MKSQDLSAKFLSPGSIVKISFWNLKVFSNVFSKGESHYDNVSVLFLLSLDFISTYLFSLGSSTAPITLSVTV